MAIAPAALAGVTAVAVDDPDYTTSEDQPLTVAAPGVLANDGPALYPERCVDLASVDETDLDGTLDIAVDGSFDFEPAADFHGTTTFTYRMGVDQGSGTCPEGALSSDATVTITVGPVNDPPSIDELGDCAAGVINVAEDSGPFDEACVAWESAGPNEDEQTWQEWVVLAEGTVGLASGPTVTEAGRLQFTPAANDSGTINLSIRGRDSGGTANGGNDLSAAVLVQINVAPVNDAPTAVADSFFALANRTLNVGAPGVLINDSDIDNATISAVKVSNPAHGVVTLAADGSFSYTPAAGYTGPDAFSYRASDGSATSPARVVTLSVSTVPPINTPTPFPSVAPTPALSAAPTLEVPSALPEASATLEPGATPAPTLVPAATPSPSLEPGASPAPEPSDDEGGLSLPVLLVLVLLGLLLAFGGAVYLPKWLRAQQTGAPMDEE